MPDKDKNKATPKHIPVIGRRFQDDEGFQYILALVDKGMVALIGLDDGLPWNYAVKCDDVKNITDDDWAKIIDGNTFTLI